MTEIFMARYFAPAVISPVGKLLVGGVFLVWTCIATYGWTKVKVDFSFDTYLVDQDRLIFKYRDTKKAYYGDIGSKVGFFVFNDQTDFLSEES